MVLAFDGKGRVFRQHVAGFFHASGTGIDKPGHDQSLRLGPGFHEPGIHQHQIGALFGHF